MKKLAIILLITSFIPFFFSLRIFKQYQKDKSIHEEGNIVLAKVVRTDCKNEIKVTFNVLENLIQEELEYCVFNPGDTVRVYFNESYPNDLVFINEPVNSSYYVSHLVIGLVLVLLAIILWKI